MQDSAIIERIAGRYPGRWMQGYVRGKIRNDPAYRIVLDALGKTNSPILDIGCGVGLLSFYLRESGFKSQILGIDFDEKKIASAREIAAANYTGMDFSARDACASGEFLGSVVVLDVLQYLPVEKQHALLQQLPRKVSPGSQCLIRATPRDASWRFQITRAADRAMHLAGWMKSPALHYLTSSEICAPFHAAGFGSEIRPLWGKTPFNSHLFVFKLTNPQRASNSLSLNFE